MADPTFSRKIEQYCRAAPPPPEQIGIIYHKSSNCSVKFCVIPWLTFSFFNCTQAQPPRTPVKEDKNPQSKIDNVPDEQLSGKSRLAFGVYGKTAAIKFMSADDIDGKADNKGQQQHINDQHGGAGIKPENQRHPRNEFNKGQDDGQQIDECRREKIVPIYYLGKGRRCQDLAVTGINKSCTENPAGSQFNPAVV